MKTILLTAINAKYIHSNLAVYSLKSYALEKCPEASIEISEYTINQEVGKILGDLYERRPSLIAFSCYIWNITMVKHLVVELKKLSPELKIWLGGPEVSYCAEKLFEELPIDGVICGEGEESFVKLVQMFTADETDTESTEQTEETDTESTESTDDKKEMPRILTCDRYVDMDSLPFVYKDWTDSMLRDRILYYETSRGCPYRCSYCLSSVDKKVRFRSIGKVLNEIDFFLQKKVKQVKFVDRTFNSKDSHAMAIWRFISEHDNQVTNFHFEIAAETLSDEAIELISKMRPGLIQLEIGVQTTNQETLKMIHRKNDFAKLRKITSRLKGFGNVHLHLDLIAGLPGENYESFINSFNSIYGLSPNELQLGFLKVLSGTEIAEMASEGHITYWKEPPYEVLRTDWISYEEIRRLKSVEEMLSIYYNSNQYVKSMAFMERFFKTPFMMYEALADYYAEKGYGIVQPSRMKRYEILYEFFKETVTGNETGRSLTLRYFAESLTYDLYARENLKKRPYFAEDGIKAGTISYMSDKDKRADVHIEAFEELLGDYRVLEFDYRNRNPVTGNAEVHDITEEVYDAKNR